MQEEVRASVVEELIRRAVAIPEIGGLDEVGASEGAEFQPEEHLEVESP